MTSDRISISAKRFEKRPRTILRDLLSGTLSTAACLLWAYLKVRRAQIGVELYSRCSHRTLHKHGSFGILSRDQPG